MEKLSTAKLKNEGLFAESEHLQQLPCRFRSDQVSKIEEIADANGLSYAEVVRRIFDKGVEAIRNENY